MDDEPPTPVFPYGAAKAAAETAVAALAPGAVIVRLGPLPDGAAARLVEDTALPGVGPIVDRLVDRWSVAPADGGESLSLAITDGGQARRS